MRTNKGRQAYRDVPGERRRILSTDTSDLATLIGRILHQTQRVPVRIRLIVTIRRECLDFMILFNERHVRTVLDPWVAHDNCGRPHASLGPGLPEPPSNRVASLLTGHWIRRGHDVLAEPVVGRTSSPVPPRRAGCVTHFLRHERSTGAGTRSAANPHAACDVARTGNGITAASTRARKGKPLDIAKELPTDDRASSRPYHPFADYSVSTGQPPDGKRARVAPFEQAAPTAADLKRIWSHVRLL